MWGVSNTRVVGWIHTQQSLGEKVESKKWKQLIFYRWSIRSDQLPKACFRTVSVQFFFNKIKINVFKGKLQKSEMTNRGQCCYRWTFRTFYCLLKQSERFYNIVRLVYTLPFFSFFSLRCNIFWWNDHVSISHFSTSGLVENNLPNLFLYCCLHHHYPLIRLLYVKAVTVGVSCATVVWSCDATLSSTSAQVQQLRAAIFSGCN